MNKLEQPVDKIETKEKEPTPPDLKADFVRHGKPEYTEKELQTAELEGKLTKEGLAQVERTAMELASKIDKKNEVVVFWVSPKQRAQETAGIMVDIFKKAGIEIAKDPHTSESLSDVKTSPEFFGNLLKESSIPKWMEYWAEADLPEGTETPEDVKKRVERVVTYLERIARTVTPPDGKKLHFICIGHEEIPRDLLEEGYGVGTKEGTGPKYAEVVNMEINKSEKDKDAVLKLKYRGEKAKLEFNKASRKFKKVND